MPPELVVGADGGNSKTDVLLASTDGELLARVSGPGTRPYLDGVPATADSLAGLVCAALAQGAVSGPVAAGSFYLANVDVAEEEGTMHAALAERGVAQRLEVSNDTFAVLRAGSPRGWGIAVVSGAGINAVGRHPDGRVERFLGIGPWSGDWGGGDAIARAGVAAAVRAGDGRGPATVLSERIAERFGMGVDEVAFAAHHGRIEMSRLRALTPVVLDAAQAGDAVAREIAERAADGVVSFAGALLRRMDLAHTDADVVLGGGLLQARDALIMDRISAQLRAIAPAVRITVLDVPPVLGALAGALELAGATATALARARDYLLG